MRLGLLFRFALINILRNIKSYSVIMILTMFGICALIFAWSYIQLSFKGLSDGFIKQGLGHFQVMDDREYSDKSTFPLEFGLTKEQVAFTQETLTQNHDDDIQVIMKRVLFSGIISNGEKSSIFVARGIESEKESSFSSVFLKVVAGSYIGTDISSDSNKYEVMIGDGVAKILNAKVGDFVSLMVTTADGALNAVDLKLVGIIKTGIKEVDKRLIYVDLALSQELLKTSKVSKIVVGLYEEDKAKEIHNFVQNALKNKGFDDNIKSYFWQDLSDFYNAVVKLYTQFFTFLGSLILIVVISTVFGSIYTSILERVREIGILKANGYSNKDVLTLITLEVFIMGVISAIVAYIFSFSMIALVNTMDIMMPPPPSRTEGFPLLLIFIWKEGFWIALSSVVVTVLAALKPSLYASRLSIAQALRE